MGAAQSLGGAKCLATGSRPEAFRVDSVLDQLDASGIGPVGHDHVAHEGVGDRDQVRRGEGPPIAPAHPAGPQPLDQHVRTPAGDDERVEAGGGRLPAEATHEVGVEDVGADAVENRAQRSARPP